MACLDSTYIAESEAVPQRLGIGSEQASTGEGVPAVTGETADVMLAPTPGKRHRRSKSMSNRPGQEGRIVRKGNYWHLRYLDDIPGQYERIDRSAKIAPAVGPGAVTKTVARQMGKAYLAQKGINSKEYFEQNCATFKPAASIQTFADRVKHWNDTKKDFNRGRTRASMQSAIEKHLLPLLKNYPVSSIDEDVAQSFVAALSRKTLGAKSVRVYFGYLRSILGKKFCRDWEVKLPPLPDKEQFSFTPEQMIKIITNSEGQERVIALTLVEAGMRINEAIGLHVEDIDFDARTIEARRSIYKGEPGPLKTKKGYRLIHISSLAANVLKAHLAGRTRGIVFRSMAGTYLSDTNLRNRWFNPLIEKLGIPQPKGSAFHALRHGRVSMLREAGVPDDVVLKWVGHSNLKMTDHYTHRKDDSLSQMAEKVSGLSQLSQVVPIAGLQKSSQAA
jgi:integrase